jgi:ribulose-phosphate 3-epimerase
MVRIVPSILSADFARLGEQAREAEAAGVDAIQIDVMDGQFVPNITFGPGVVAAIRPLVSLTLEVHLMIVKPDRFLGVFAEAGADRLIVHQEACDDLRGTLESIHSLGAKAGVTLSPETPAAAVRDAFDLVDLIQVMTVHPGFGGQDFLFDQLAKIRELREMLATDGLEIPIGVDGGVETTTAPQIVAAGAQVLVAGSSVYNNHATVAENIAALLASVEGVEAA